jgi:hypothetical protein
MYAKTTRKSLINSLSVILGVSGMMLVYVWVHLDFEAMGNWIYYVAGIFVIAMTYLLALGGAALVGGKFDNWKSHIANRTKSAFKWKRKRFQRY